MFALLTALAEGSPCRQAVSSACKVSKTGQECPQCPSWMSCERQLAVPQTGAGIVTVRGWLCLSPHSCLWHGAPLWLGAAFAERPWGKGLRPQRHERSGLGSASDFYSKASEG